MNDMILILGTIIIFNFSYFVLDSVNKWWNKSTLKNWWHPYFVLLFTIGVMFGIEFNIFRPGAILLPIIVGIPYINGTILGIWHNMKYAGEKLISTRGVDAESIMIKCLKKIGYQPTKNEDGTLSVLYQGEFFRIEFGEMYARIWDLMWANIKADDPDMPKIREAVNVANYDFGATVLLTAPDDKGLIGFHSRRDIMLHPACPDNVQYVKGVLDSFFKTKERVHSHYQQINAKQMEAQKNRRPVGFTTNTNSKE